MTITTFILALLPVIQVKILMHIPLIGRTRFAFFCIMFNLSFFVMQAGAVGCEIFGYSLKLIGLLFMVGVIVAYWRPLTTAWLTPSDSDDQF